MTLVPSSGTLKRVLGGCVMFAHDAENDQRSGKQNPKGKELAAAGFEKTEEVRGFMVAFGVNGGCR